MCALQEELDPTNALLLEANFKKLVEKSNVIVYLSGRSMGDAEILKLARALDRNLSLTTLDLSSNRIGTEAASK